MSSMYNKDKITIKLIISHKSFSATWLGDIKPSSTQYYSMLIPTVSIRHFRNIVSSFTYDLLFKTDIGTNWGQPEATFISFLGLWNELEAGSGRKD